MWCFQEESNIFVTSQRQKRLSLIFTSLAVGSPTCTYTEGPQPTLYLQPPLFHPAKNTQKCQKVIPHSFKTLQHLKAEMFTHSNSQRCNIEQIRRGEGFPDCLPQITINASLAVLEKSLWDWTKENAMWHLYRGTVWHPYVQLQHSSLTMLWSTFSACRYTCLCFKPRNWGSRQLHSLSDACFMQTSLNEILSAQEVWWKSMLFFIFFMFFNIDMSQS